MNNFGNTKAMTLNFFSKCSKIYVDFKNAIKYCETVFAFKKKCILIVCDNLSVLWAEFLARAVNRLTNSPKISDMTKRDVFQLFLFINYVKKQDKIALLQTFAVFGTR